MSPNAHFEDVPDWADAAARVTFRPLVPRSTAGGTLTVLRVYVRDYKGREIPPDERVLEAYYGTFSLSQSRRSAADAKHAALEVSYGRDPQPLWILGREGRGYELGPEPGPDDSDCRSPAVVAWADGEIFYFLASSERSLTDLIGVATSLY